jgi:hypothetical protein
MELVYLAICGLIIRWCYSIAEKNGRHKGLAIFWGVVGGLWAVLVYYIIGKPKKNELR